MNGEYFCCTFTTIFVFMAENIILKAIEMSSSKKNKERNVCIVSMSGLKNFSYQYSMHTICWPGNRQYH